MSIQQGWYADPAGSGQLRWWDGQAWSAHLRPAPGQPQPPVQQQPVQQQPVQQHPVQQQPVQQQQGQVQSARGEYSQYTQGYGDQSYGGYAQAPVGHSVANTSRNVFTEPMLIVSQKRKLIELTNEYLVYGQDGAEIGAVVEVGQSGLKKAVRLLSSYDQFLTHRLEVRDTAGQVLLRLTRPAKVFKSTVIVEAPNGQEIGRLVQQNVFGKIRFGLEVGGQQIGTLKGENWAAWDFALTDAYDREVARVTKTFEGFLTTLFTTADNYVVHIHNQLGEPLRSMAIAAALTVDTALKQDSRGWN